MLFLLMKIEIAEHVLHVLLFLCGLGWEFYYFTCPHFCDNSFPSAVRLVFRALQYFGGLGLSVKISIRSTIENTIFLLQNSIENGYFLFVQ